MDLVSNGSGILHHKKLIIIVLGSVLTTASWYLMGLLLL